MKKTNHKCEHHYYFIIQHEKNKKKLNIFVIELLDSDQLFSSIKAASKN